MIKHTPCRKKAHYKRKSIVSKYTTRTSRNMTVLTIHQAK